MKKLFHILAAFTNVATRRSILDSALIFVFLSTFSVSLLAAQFYRYKNDNGQLVLTQTLPAEHADKGYDILNEKGRVIRTIAPALTPEEIAKRDAALELERLAQIEKEKQDAIDEELKQLYSQANDAVRVLNRRVVDIDDVIKMKYAKIKSLESQVIEQESRAAERQRKGLPIGEDALDKLSVLKKGIENNHADIKELYAELEKVVVEFDKKIARLEVITRSEASDYPAVLDFIETLRQARPTD